MQLLPVAAEPPVQRHLFGRHLPPLLWKPLLQFPQTWPPCDPHSIPLTTWPLEHLQAFGTHGNSLLPEEDFLPSVWKPRLHEEQLTSPWTPHVALADVVAPFPFVHLHRLETQALPARRYPGLHVAHFSSLVSQAAPKAPFPLRQSHVNPTQKAPFFLKPVLHARQRCWPSTLHEDPSAAAPPAHEHVFVLQ